MMWKEWVIGVLWEKNICGRLILDLLSHLREKTKGQEQGKTSVGELVFSASSELTKNTQQILRIGEMYEETCLWGFVIIYLERKPGERK